ncbi:MAG: methylated-DNA--[protein]-cysteine S-methyltransferase [Chloroflexi bacterium]|nr:methylated-DNA--[protein]-cysteine S-methyltransferase [Chloroflexota bacterium]
MGIAASRAGLLRTTLPQASPEAAQQLLDDLLKTAVPDDGTFSGLANRLRRYFEGEPVDFEDALDPEGASQFYRQVWQATRSIPYGETRSYAWVAREIGRPRASRAVGQALGRNPFPIVVPCHRVLGSDGSLCGFGGGLEMKRRLLEIEAGAENLRSSARPW